MNCATCGAPAAPNDRFCGSCGAEVTAGQTATAPPPDEWADVPPMRERAAPRRSARLLLVALPVLLIGAGLAFWNFKGESGGAGSPEAAVVRLVNAITDEDPLGLLAALDPDEANVLRTAYKAAADQADKDGYIKGDDPLAGLDLTATNMRFTVTKLADDVASVNVTDGTIGYSFSPGTLSGKARDVLTNDDGDPIEASSDSASISELLEESDGPAPAIVTVQRGGSWYVSVLYSIAEAVRSESGAPAPVYGSQPESKGASSPKGVIEAMVSSISSINIDAGLQLIDPESLKVLVDYRSSILSEVNERDVAEARDNFNIVLDRLDVTTMKLDSAHTRVDVTTLEGHGSATHQEDQYSYDSDGDSRYAGTEEVTDTASVSLSNTCLTISSDGDRDTNCLSDLDHTFGINKFFLVVVERKGQFYLDPLATIAEYLKIVAESGDLEKAICDATEQCDA